MKLINLFLIVLITLPVVNGLSINVNTDTPVVNGFDNISVNYEIILDSVSEINYELLLINDGRELLLLNSSCNDSSIINNFSYNASSIASGTYELALRLNTPLSYTVKSINNVTIRKNVNLNIDVPNKVFVKGDSEVVNLSFINFGNTDLGVSAYFKGVKSEVSLNPQSFSLVHDDSKVVQLIVKKPVSDYNATLIVIITDKGNESRREFPVSVIIPVINLSLGSVIVKSSINESFIEAVINNNGNSPINANVSVRTFGLFSGFKTLTNNVLVNAGESVNYSLSIPKISVIGLTVDYFNGDRVISIINELSVLNKFPVDIKLSKERVALLVVLFFISLIILKHKLFGHRRP